MPSIVTPRPRSARVARATIGPAIHHDLFFDTSRASTSSSTPPPRLLSPIRLAPSASVSQSNCIFTSKRRVRPYASRLRPVSPASRPATPTPRSTHPFDQLPWISALDAEPQHSTNPSDIADLSLIPDLSLSSRPSGPGPVRRRKTSLRSSPFAPPTNHATTTSSSKCTISRATPPPRDTHTPAHPCPLTPHSRFNPSRVIFRHLMPVLCD